MLVFCWFYKEPTQLGFDCRFFLTSGHGVSSVDSVFMVLAMGFNLSLPLFHSDLVQDQGSGFHSSSVLKTFARFIWVCSVHVQPRHDSYIDLSSSPTLSDPSPCPHTVYLTGAPFPVFLIREIEFSQSFHNLYCST